MSTERGVPTPSSGFFFALELVLSCPVCEEETPHRQTALARLVGDGPRCQRCVTREWAQRRSEARRRRPSLDGRTEIQPF